MSVGPANHEIEVKLRAPTPEAAAELLSTHGFTVSKSRIFETNAVFDTESDDLRESGRLLRVRKAGEDGKLTYKGPAIPGRHKNREELEIDISDVHTLERILSRVGYRRSFLYEKYRTEFEGDGGTATLDETPIGTFLELEGDPEWIDRTAQLLGFAESDYITKSYGRLYLEWCAERGERPADMTFSS